MSPKVCQYTILNNLVQLDGFDANETKKTKWTDLENTEKSSLQQNDYRNKVMVKKLEIFLGSSF